MAQPQPQPQPPLQPQPSQRMSMMGPSAMNTPPRLVQQQPPLVQLQPPPPQQQMQAPPQQSQPPQTLQQQMEPEPQQQPPPPPKQSAPGNPAAQLHPEIRSVVQLTLAHTHKIYFSGPLVRLIERQPDGQKPTKDEGWKEVWAQLSGTTLSVWDMAEIQEASKQGKQVPPTYINVTDAVSECSIRRADSA